MGIAKVKHGGVKNANDNSHGSKAEVENLRRKLQSSFDDLVRIFSRELRARHHHDRKTSSPTTGRELLAFLKAFGDRTVEPTVEGIVHNVHGINSRWSLVLPWLLSLFFGVVLPLAQTMSHRRNRRRVRGRFPVAD